MKFAVGVMLTSFGVFWAGEGVGVAWPGEDVAILAIAAFMLGFALLGVAVLQRRANRIAVAA
jgi:uncharacterized membrane protein